MWRLLGVFVVFVSLLGCDTDTQDLVVYVDEVKKRPSGKIAALPEYKPYESFVYDALRYRSPFKPPAREVALDRTIQLSNLKPDKSRPKQPLEAFHIDELKMVGMLGNEPELRALVRAPDGKIYQVSQGHYMGKNHGQVVGISETKFDVIELVSAGINAWTERPRSVRLDDN